MKSLAVMVVAVVIESVAPVAAAKIDKAIQTITTYVIKPPDLCHVTQ